jgi:hypothetical protein
VTDNTKNGLYISYFGRYEPLYRDTILSMSGEAERILAATKRVELSWIEKLK